MHAPTGRNATRSPESNPPTRSIARQPCRQSSHLLIQHRDDHAPTRAHLGSQCRPTSPSSSAQIPATTTTNNPNEGRYVARLWNGSLTTTLPQFLPALHLSPLSPLPIVGWGCWSSALLPQPRSAAVIPASLLAKFLRLGKPPGDGDWWVFSPPDGLSNACGRASPPDRARLASPPLGVEGLVMRANQRARLGVRRRHLPGGGG